jgi:uncharacterized protein
MTASKDALTEQAELVKQLLASPGCFPHAADDREYLETHISHLLLVGDHVYKIKKPLDLGFLDFSTLQKRRQCCQEELRLNRRLAPELYLDVVAIGGTSRQPQLDGGSSPPIEYAVKMRRFRQQALLSRTLPDPAELAELARQIADFHQRIPKADLESPWGTPAAVLAPMEQNFRQIRDLKQPLLESDRLDSLQSWTESVMDNLTPLLDERRELGRIRECHGDLHLGNITRFEGRLMPFDGIEFNPGLRWIDVLSDLAFLLMDLLHRGLSQAAAQLLNDYLELTGDYAGLPLLPFYLLYRAMVRAKVCAIRFCQSDVDQAEAAELLDEYLRYLKLAESVSNYPPAALLLTHGVSGSGKSTVGAWLAQQLMAIRIRSDVERKRLFPGDEPAAQARRYSSAASAVTYAHLCAMAERLLRAGYAVIVDAAFLKQAQREPFFTLAESLETPLLILDCQAEDPLLQARIIQRETDGKDPSEADLAVLKRQQSEQEVLGEAERRHSVVVDTASFPPPGMLATVLQRLMGQGASLEP